MWGVFIVDDHVPSAPEILFSIRTLHYKMEMGDISQKFKK